MWPIYTNFNLIMQLYSKVTTCLQNNPIKTNHSGNGLHCYSHVTSIYFGGFGGTGGLMQ